MCQLKTELGLEGMKAPNLIFKIPKLYKMDPIKAQIAEEMLIKLQQDQIFLDEPTHTYNVLSHPHLKFTSATQFIGEFFNPFDDVGIATKLAEKDSGRYSDYDTAGEILAEWDRISERGTAVHKELEDWCFEWMGTPEGQQVDSPITLTRAKHGVEWLKENLEPHFILFPEVKLFSPRLQIAGTLDLLIYEPKQDLWIIADWKTNRKINKSSWKGKKGIKHATRFLDDCKFNKYGLQMSLYRWILENEYGFSTDKILKQILVHLRPKQTRMYPLGVKEFFTPYLSSNIEKMVEYRLEMKERGELFPKLI